LLCRDGICDRLLGNDTAPGAGVRLEPAAAAHAGGQPAARDILLHGRAGAAGAWRGDDTGADRHPAAGERVSDPEDHPSYPAGYARNVDHRRADSRPERPTSAAPGRNGAGIGDLLPGRVHRRGTLPVDQRLPAAVGDLYIAAVDPADGRAGAMAILAALPAP